MKKVFCIFLVTLTIVLCSCSNKKEIEVADGFIECYSIKVTFNYDSYDKTIFNEKYTRTAAMVYEFKSDDGDSIYTDRKLEYYDSDGLRLNRTIHLYKDRYASDFIEYKYAGFVGWLTVENLYFLDVNNKIVDSLVKYSEYLYSTKPSSSEEGGDNKKAYKCAKKGYYILSGYMYENSAFSLSSDLEEKGLERHTYTKFSDDCIITFRKMWF